MTHWQRFVSQLKRDAERKALFDFVADDRTCSEQSERNSETGEFIRYSEASTLNKLCLSHNRALHGHYVLYLFAMSAAFDVRKYFALASLFVCGQLHKGRVRHAMRGCNYVAKVPRSKKNNSLSCYFCVCTTKSCFSGDFRECV